MRRTLLVTNDFPPRPGGIQSYLENLVDRLPPDQVVVYAPRWRGCEEFDARVPYTVIRHRTTLMLPSPFVAFRAAALIRAHDIHTVWFGAAAPLAVLSPALRRAGARRIIASTHGHEVGWSMLPAARQVLRFIGTHTDVITYVSKYTRSRFSAALGAQAALEYLPPGVDIDRFTPDPVARHRIRQQLGIVDRPTVLCLSRLVPRKGQDSLIRALPAIVREIPDAVLVIAGGGPYAEKLHELARTSGVDDHVVFAGSVPVADLAAFHAMPDVFAMPCRTRGRGLDVEGLGIVFLEASASGIPVVAGDSGGAPETVVDGVTGHVVNGRDIDRLAATLVAILRDADKAREMGRAGRQFAVDRWQWRHMAARLDQLL
ncbi:glycosyltransferase [Gordonia pseudamarae]|mgnify:FL=1|jgi:phosphatidylinositol alpha-1,6-mannosyltransferase|uniref:Glycosyltransferase n=1 Tax=Gordonia pseudamarae TaxID=2831662 RepID=A0ABX6IKF7_9ACTN|nr:MULTISPECIES: glycosyltransferase family 4 protein [Gordonia]MBD0022619.1 glycosyltransferase family 4 protein [Gordonia sp. (in: high G+C Gram-positive bacteria)]QHN26822.1 glycosyltransferase [Gordonia pseudamarae]QHN35713.1 glycosyltransferase [Gordonia pseudamarae]